MSTITDLGIPNINSGILQPKLKNRYRVTFANMGRGVDSTPVSAQAIQVSRPKLTFEENELRRYNSVDWVPGFHTFEPLKLVIEDDILGTASTVIQAQAQSQQWIVGAQGQWMAAAGEGSLIKFATYLELLDGNTETVESWTYEGCWLKEIDWGEMDYHESKPLTIALTVRFTNAYQVIGGYTDGPGQAVGGAGKFSSNT